MDRAPPMVLLAVVSCLTFPPDLIGHLFCRFVLILLLILLGCFLVLNSACVKSLINGSCKLVVQDKGGLPMTGAGWVGVPRSQLSHRPKPYFSVRSQKSIYLVPYCIRTICLLTGVLGSQLSHQPNPT